MENDVICGYKIAPARRMACAVYPSRRQRAQSGRPFFELIDGSWSAEPPTLRWEYGMRSEQRKPAQNSAVYNTSHFFI